VVPITSATTSERPVVDTLQSVFLSGSMKARLQALHMSTPKWVRFEFQRFIARQT